MIYSQLVVFYKNLRQFKRHRDRFYLSRGRVIVFRKP